MWRLHIPTSLSDPPANGSVSIIVGQRSCISSAVAAPRTVCVLAGYVPCDDPSVAEEQMECLERVLPFGIEVLGFAGDMGALKSLATQLSELRKKELVEVIVDNGKGLCQLDCRMFGAPEVKVDVVESEIAFVEARFAFHTYDRTFPLLVSCCNAPPRVVDGEGYTPLTEGASSSPGSLELVQTGAASSTLGIYVVMAPSFMSASGLYETLFRQLRAALRAGTTRLIMLNAHNAHLSYCCRVKRRANILANTGDVTEDEWAEVLEMMEDATGEIVSRGDLRGLKPLSQSAERDETSAAQAVKKSTAYFFFFLVSFLAVPIAALVLMR
ncbi:hypothetical protein JKF63_03191 [Porcisia hertigi]|uniref:Uncharacterized protein n=1 Tax=Porcisia hertigi TaxID=2761500 RepID=A0A836L7L0_9TRYP|nr:hypothetical protein JKF63_03191 [Porcisia hertigi]